LDIIISGFEFKELKLGMFPKLNLKQLNQSVFNKIWKLEMLYIENEKQLLDKN